VEGKVDEDREGWNARVLEQVLVVVVEGPVEEGDEALKRNSHGGEDFMDFMKTSHGFWHDIPYKQDYECHAR